MQTFLAQQYGFVLSSRSVLMAYAATLAPGDFIRSTPAFGRGSVRNLLVHICDTYLYWIAVKALKNDLRFEPYDCYADVRQCAAYFEKADYFMAEFISVCAADPFKELPVERSSGTEHISPLKLFTHVTTHEFHHKGQIMSLSRELGYTPVDADIIR